MSLADLEFDDDLEFEDNDYEAVQSYWNELLGPEDDSLDWDSEDDEETEFFRTHVYFSVKAITEGCATLEEAADILHANAAHLEGLIDEGYELDEPVDNGYYSILKPQHVLEEEILEKRNH